jgi:hypothetical protein
MKLARWIFILAGIYGVVVITPLFFMEHHLNDLHPPAITHPEYYYGFVCVCLAAQFMFLVIATDPLRYRPLMVVGMWEKFSWAVACLVLAMMGRIPSQVTAMGMIDLVLGILFVIAWTRTRSSNSV